MCIYIYTDIFPMFPYIFLYISYGPWAPFFPSTDILVHAVACFYTCGRKSDGMLLKSTRAAKMMEGCLFHTKARKSDGVLTILHFFKGGLTIVMECCMYLQLMDIKGRKRDGMLQLFHNRGRQNDGVFAVFTSGQDWSQK